MVRQILQLGYVAECNDAMARQLGFSSAGEVIGKHLGELIQDWDEELLATFFSAAEGNFQTRTVTLKTTDAAGNPHYLLRTEMPVVQDGLLIRAWGITRDITELRLAENALQESEERFRSLFENATVGIYRTTPAGQILMANPTLVKMLGYESLEELVERNLEEQGFEPNYPRQLFHERMAREGEVKGLEAVWTRQDGSVMFVRESARAIRGEGNQILVLRRNRGRHHRAQTRRGNVAGKRRALPAIGGERGRGSFAVRSAGEQGFLCQPRLRKGLGPELRESVREPPFVPGRHPSG